MATLSSRARSRGVSQRQWSAREFARCQSLVSMSLVLYKLKHNTKLRTLRHENIMVLTRRVLRGLNSPGPAAWCPRKTSWDPTLAGASGTPGIPQPPRLTDHTTKLTGLYDSPVPNPTGLASPEVCGKRRVPPMNSGPIFELCDLHTMI